MKKINQKKIMSIILAFAIVLSLIPIMPVKVKAEEKYCKGRCHEYSISNGTLSIYPRAYGPITASCGFSDIIRDNNVTDIYSYAGIEDNSFFSSDEVNDKIKSAYIYIFNYLNNKIIGANVFKNCTALKSLTMTNVDSIGASAFENCSSLEELDIRTPINSIGANTFKNCSSLKYVNIVNPAISISDSAFTGVGEYGKNKCLLTLVDGITPPVNNMTPWHGGYFNGHAHNIVYGKTTTVKKDDTITAYCTNPGCTLPNVSKQNPLKYVFSKTESIYDGQYQRGHIIKDRNGYTSYGIYMYHDGIEENLDKWVMVYSGETCDGKTVEPQEYPPKMIGKYTVKIYPESCNKSEVTQTISYEIKPDVESGTKVVYAGENTEWDYNYYKDGSYTSNVTGDESGKAKSMCIYCTTGAVHVNLTNISADFGKKIYFKDIFQYYLKEDPTIIGIHVKYWPKYGGFYEDGYHGLIIVYTIHHSHQKVENVHDKQIDYYCTEPYCDFDYDIKKPLTLKIAVPKNIYEGEKIEISVGTKEQQKAVKEYGCAVPKIEKIEFYNGIKLLKTQPKAEGKYTVKVTIRGKEFSYNFSVIKKKGNKKENKKETNIKCVEKLNSGFEVTNTSGLKVSWGAVKGATSYEVYAAYCGKKDKFKKVKTIKINKKTKTSLKITKIDKKAINKKKNVKVYVAAYKTVKGKKKLLGKSITGYVAGTKNNKYTNVKALNVKKNSISLKKGKTAKINATTVKLKKSKKLIKDVSEFRYSTTNNKIATVNRRGIITANKKGTCYIYVYAINGVSKKIKVIVK